MKKIISMILLAVMLLSLVGCGETEPAEEIQPVEPQISQMKAICELAVMDCYFHNVAKFFEEDAEGALWWKKDKNFWIEYSGIVTLGVDVSQVVIEIRDTQVYISIPEARVLGCKVDEASLSAESFIVAKDSAEIEAEDEIEAFRLAQEQMESQALGNTALLANAQQRVQSLLEEYVNNIGTAVGKQYTINWGTPGAEPTATPEPVETEE